MRRTLWETVHYTLALRAVVRVCLFEQAWNDLFIVKGRRISTHIRIRRHPNDYAAGLYPMFLWKKHVYRKQYYM